MLHIDRIDLLVVNNRVHQILGTNHRRALVDEMTSLVAAYIKLAAAPAPSNGTTPMLMPADVRRTLRACGHCAVLSDDVPVDTSGRYDNVAFVADVSDTVRFVGGINKPKFIACTDSHGRCVGVYLCCVCQFVCVCLLCMLHSVLWCLSHAQLLFLLRQYVLLCEGRCLFSLTRKRCPFYFLLR